MSSESGYIVSCGRCGKVMGDLDENELLFFASDESDGGLCFGCDPESAATTPSIFWQWQEGDVFAIGNEQFKLEENVSGYPVLVRLHTHERAHARGLSSYTKLNETVKNRQFWREGWEVEFCPNCMDDPKNFDIQKRQNCSVCGGSGGGNRCNIPP